MRKWLKAGARGQTLLEVLVATAVVGVTLVAVVMGSTRGIRVARVSRERSEARQLVGSKIEEVREMRDADPEVFFLLGNREEVESSGIAPNYTMTTTYTDVSGLGQQFQVDVVITWQDGDVDYNVDQSTFLSIWQ